MFRIPLFPKYVEPTNDLNEIKEKVATNEKRIQRLERRVQLHEVALGLRDLNDDSPPKV